MLITLVNIFFTQYAKYQQCTNSRDINVRRGKIDIIEHLLEVRNPTGFPANFPTLNPTGPATNAPPAPMDVSIPLLRYCS